MDVELAFTLGSQNGSIILDTLSFHLAVGEVKVSSRGTQSLKLGDKIRDVLSVSTMICEIITAIQGFLLYLGM